LFSLSLSLFFLTVLFSLHTYILVFFTILFSLRFFRSPLCPQSRPHFTTVYSTPLPWPFYSSLLSRLENESISFLPVILPSCYSSTFLRLMKSQCRKYSRCAEHFLSCTATGHWAKLN
jgi:hypothetical protein